MPLIMYNINYIFPRFYSACIHVIYSIFFVLPILHNINIQMYVILALKLNSD